MHCNGNDATPIPFVPLFKRFHSFRTRGITISDQFGLLPSDERQLSVHVGWSGDRIGRSQVHEFSGIVGLAPTSMARFTASRNPRHYDTVGLSAENITSAAASAERKPACCS